MLSVILRTIDMILFNLICKFDNFHPHESSNYSFLEGLLGALIGAVAALSVFYLETNREKEKDARVKAEAESNALVYFSSLIKNIIAQSEKQITSYKEHSKKILNQPFDFHSLHIIVTEDLNRVVNKFDHERIFHSYLSKFGNSTDNMKKFQKI